MKLILLSIIILFSSCATTRFDNEYASPVDGSAFQLSDKNNFFATGSIHTPKKDNNHPFQSNFQLGYSPIKHLGVVVSHNYFQLGEKNFNQFSKIRLFNTVFGGYYLIQDEKKYASNEFENFLLNRVLLTAYLGYANGKTINKYSNHTSANSSFHFHKYYFQGGIQWQNELLGLSAQIKVGKSIFIKEFAMVTFLIMMLPILKASFLTILTRLVNIL